MLRYNGSQLIRDIRRPSVEPARSVSYIEYSPITPSVGSSLGHLNAQQRRLL